MSLFVLATGALVADPQRRTSTSGKEFATAALRTPTEEEAVLLSVIVFDAEACAGLLNLRKGDSCSITGRAKLTTWTGKDGEQRHGLSVVAERIMTAYAVGKRRIVTARVPERARLHWGEGESNV